MRHACSGQAGGYASQRSAPSPHTPCPEQALGHAENDVTVTYTDERGVGEEANETEKNQLGAGALIGRRRVKLEEEEEELV